MYIRAEVSIRVVSCHCRNYPLPYFSLWRNFCGKNCLQVFSAMTGNLALNVCRHWEVRLSFIPCTVTISWTSLRLPLKFFHHDFDCFDVGLNSTRSWWCQKGNIETSFYCDFESVANIVFWFQSANFGRDLFKVIRL